MNSQLLFILARSWRTFTPERTTNQRDLMSVCATLYKRNTLQWKMTSTRCVERMQPACCCWRYRYDDDGNITKFVRLVNGLITQRLSKFEQNLYLFLSISMHNGFNLIVNRLIKCNIEYSIVWHAPKHKQIKFFSSFFSSSHLKRMVFSISALHG